MLIHPVDPSYTLIEVGDLDREPVAPAAAAYEGPLRTVLRWAREYLCAPHPELGRPGNVCPYAPGALERGVFYLTVQPGADPDPAEVTQRLRGYRDWFIELSEPSGSARMFHTILMVFPELPTARAPQIVDALQIALKGEFVARGLMIGEFHDGPPPKGGLWNPDFRPLRCPLPMLAIRHMVPTDYLFLEDNPEHVTMYLRLYGDQVPPHLRERVLNRLIHLLLTNADRESTVSAGADAGSAVPSGAEHGSAVPSGADPGSALAPGPGRDPFGLAR
jgi:hypothetical protein